MAIYRPNLRNISTYKNVSMKNMQDTLQEPPAQAIPQKPDVLSERCPSRGILNHITSRWGVLVLIALQDKTLRFSELRRTIGGVSERMLSQTLKVLEEDGFIARKAYEVVPPHVEYSLTAARHRMRGPCAHAGKLARRQFRADSQPQATQWRISRAKVQPVERSHQWPWPKAPSLTP